jgi:hypothetical protein
MDSKEALEQLDDSGWKHIPNVADVDVRSYYVIFTYPTSLRPPPPQATILLCEWFHRIPC